MSKWMPPKPDFDKMKYGYSSYFPAAIGSYHREEQDIEILIKDTFDKWYDKEIRPLFENAITFYGYRDLNSDGHLIFHECGISRDPEFTALVMKIESIKEETAEDLLEESIDLFNKGQAGIYGIKANLDFDQASKNLQSKIKVYLERKKK
jgi:hypothetical protein